MYIVTHHTSKSNYIFFLYVVSFIGLFFVHIFHLSLNSKLVLMFVCECVRVRLCMSHLARWIGLFNSIMIITINQWLIVKTGGRCWFHWMHIVQYIQFCATIDRFCSVRRKNRRKNKKSHIRSMIKNENKSKQRLNIAKKHSFRTKHNFICLFYFIVGVFFWFLFVNINNKIVGKINRKPKRKTIWRVNFHLNWFVFGNFVLFWFSSSYHLNSDSLNLDKIA